MCITKSRTMQSIVPLMLCAQLRMVFLQCQCPGTTGKETQDYCKPQKVCSYEEEMSHGTLYNNPQRKMPSLSTCETWKTKIGEKVENHFSDPLNSSNHWNEILEMLWEIISWNLIGSRLHMCNNSDTLGTKICKLANTEVLTQEVSVEIRGPDSSWDQSDYMLATEWCRRHPSKCN